MVLVVIVVVVVVVLLIIELSLACCEKMRHYPTRMTVSARRLPGYVGAQEFSNVITQTT